MEPLHPVTPPHPTAMDTTANAAMRDPELYAETLQRTRDEFGVGEEYRNWPRVIGLYSDSPGCGKTTAAAWLVEKGYARVPFAAPLRRLTVEFLTTFGYSTEDAVRRVNHYKEVPLSLAYGLTPRQLMRTLGTEWGRQCIHPDIWVRAWEHSIRGLWYVVVDDVRFPNEVEAVRRLGGELWRVDRPRHFGDVDHGSEGALQGKVPDWVVCNDGCVDLLRSNMADAFDAARRRNAARHSGVK